MLALVRQLSSTIAALAICLGMVSCAPGLGYPTDPENTDATLQSLQTYFQPAVEAEYDSTTDSIQRAALRNRIILNRVHAYDIEFDRFERNLWGEGNAITTGGDLVGLVLGGLGATTGNAATKAALSAAFTGVVGAQAAVSRDLYFERTLPAIMSQMEANRAKVELIIMNGLKKSDAEYPLAEAEIDLGNLQRAGSIPEAVTVVTQQTSQNNQAAQAQLNALRTLSLSSSSTSQRMRRWLYPDGKETDAGGKAVAPDAAKIALLQLWMAKDTVDPALKGIPPEQFVDGTSALLEADRARAIADLKIP